jgi:hypothetical protein
MSLSSNVDRRPYPECNAQLVAGEQAVFHHLPGSPAVTRYAASVR